MIGAAGFVGRYLVREMRNNKIETFVTKLPHEKFTEESVNVYDLDILDKDAIVNICMKYSLITYFIWQHKVQ